MHCTVIFLRFLHFHIMYNKIRFRHVCCKCTNKRNANGSTYRNSWFMTSTYKPVYWFYSCKCLFSLSIFNFCWFRQKWQIQKKAIKKYCFSLITKLLAICQVSCKILYLLHIRFLRLIRLFWTSSSFSSYSVKWTPANLY